MGHERKIADELRKLLHNLFTGRRSSDHFVGDAGIGFDKGTDPASRVHQVLKAVDDPGALNEHGADFNRPAAILRRKAVGFKVKDYKRGGVHFGRMKISENKSVPVFFSWFN